MSWDLPSDSQAPYPDALKIESIDLDAQGIAHDASGRVVFIENALPSEWVIYQPTQKKKPSGVVGTLFKGSMILTFVSNPNVSILALSEARVVVARCIMSTLGRRCQSSKEASWINFGIWASASLSKCLGH